MPFIGTTGSGQLVRDTAKDKDNRFEMSASNPICDQNIVREKSHRGRKDSDQFGNILKLFFFSYSLLYSSLNPAADTLISEKKWRYSWLEVLLRRAGTVVPWGKD